jgi:Putative F0F1-ATPase subunit Ca2+/Mg2+ transporter
MPEPTADHRGAKEAQSGAEHDSSAVVENLVTLPPAPPELNVALPVHPVVRDKQSVVATSYRKSAMASSAVTGFVMPIITLCLGGYWLDQKWKHTAPYLSMVGVVVGLITGVSTLLRTLNKMGN